LDPKIIVNEPGASVLEAAGDVGGTSTTGAEAILAAAEEVVPMPSSGAGWGGLPKSLVNSPAEELASSPGCVPAASARLKMPETPGDGAGEVPGVFGS